jgi:hypothetical protein
VEVQLARCLAAQNLNFKNVFRAAWFQADRKNEIERRIVAAEDVRLCFSMTGVSGRSSVSMFRSSSGL